MQIAHCVAPPSGLWGNGLFGGSPGTALGLLGAITLRQVKLQGKLGKVTRLLHACELLSFCEVRCERCELCDCASIVSSVK